MSDNTVMSGRKGKKEIKEKKLEKRDGNVPIHKWTQNGSTDIKEGQSHKYMKSLKSKLKNRMKAHENKTRALIRKNALSWITASKCNLWAHTHTIWIIVPKTSRVQKLRVHTSFHRQAADFVVYNREGLIFWSTYTNKDHVSCHSS